MRKSTPLRTQILTKVAHKIGFEYMDKDSWGIESLLKDFYLFRKGRRRQIRHLMQKKDGLMETNMYIFDYHFIKGYGNNSKRMAQTVFFIDSRKLGLPQFLMQPEKFFNKAANWIGIQKDIDFVDYPKFSTQYQLNGDDEDFIRYSIKPDFLHFFSFEQGWTLEGLNYFLIIYRKNRLITADSIEVLHGKGMHILKMLRTENL